jgi:hypothetical protein
MLAASMVAISNVASAATVPYGVFEHNRYSRNISETISLLTGDHVSQLAKVEGRDDASVLSVTVDDLIITGIQSSDNGDDFTSGTWHYSGAASIDWLVIKYGRNFGIYHITAGDTSGVWDIAQLENYSNQDASGAKVRKNKSVHYSSISHATAYTSLTTVPLPAAIWLFMGGLAGLVTIGRRKPV